MILVPLLAACAPSDSTLSAELQAQLDNVSALVDGHVAVVQATMSMADMGPLEDQHTSDMAAAMDDLHATMSNMMACGGSGMMEMHRLDMMDEVTAHGEGYTDHADMMECWADEEAYKGAMHDHMDDIRADTGDFDDDAPCSGDEGMMEP